MLGLARCKRETAKPNLENDPSVRAEALSRAKEAQREDVLEILDTHLRKFQAREVIIERAP